MGGGYIHGMSLIQPALLPQRFEQDPYEILTGNKPNISYFRVFGCKCFYLIKGCRLTKFEAKSLEGIFVGYGVESHTYRVYDIASRRIIESCSVVFDENDGSQVAQFHVSDVDDVIPRLTHISIPKLNSYSSSSK